MLTLRGLVFITVLILCSTFISGQGNVHLDRLKGPGTSPVLVDSDGNLARAMNFDGTREYSISPVDFRGFPIPIRNISLTREFYAPIHLPDETKMRSVTFWYEDNTPPNLLVEIYRAGNTERTLVMTRQVMGTPGVPTAVTTDLGFGPIALINNEDYFYYMRIACIEDGLLAPWPQELVFYRASIRYEY